MKNRLAPAIAAALLTACSAAKESPANPALPGPGEPNGTAATATSFTLGSPVVAEISAETDLDYYALTIPAGGATVRIQTFDAGGTACDPVNESVDTRIRVLDAAQHDLLDCSGYPSPCDDSGPVWCEDATVTLAEGTSYVEVSGVPDFPFSYTLKVTVQ